MMKEVKMNTTLEMMEWTQGNYHVSTDKARLDLEVIHGFLKTTYWASERRREMIEQVVEKSLCFGMYEGLHQIGFARVLTDEVVVSWLGDVFIHPSFQGRGLGKWLMTCIISHPVLVRTKCILGTRDAHGLYEQFDFVRKEQMLRVPNGPIS